MNGLPGARAPTQEDRDMFNVLIIIDKDNYRYIIIGNYRNHKI